MIKGFEVSVIIPTHKRLSTLERALLSAINQTYLCREIIVVSDGFDLDTDVMMKKYVSKHNAITYLIVDPPQGGNHARNVGIASASSPYIAFLDDDDEWHEKKIERQIRVFIEDSNIGLVCAASNIVFSEIGSTIKSVPSAVYDSSRLILLRNCIGGTSSVVIKKSVLIQCGMFDEQLKARQDYELWIRVCQITKVGVIKEPSFQYHNDLNIIQVSSNTKGYIDAYEYILKKHKGLFSDKLTKSELKACRSEFMIMISKKALRNSEPLTAREYAMKALRLGEYRGALFTYILSFFPYKMIMKARVAIGKVMRKQY